MITKNEIKLFRSLRTKKIREHEGLFVVEGLKILDEILASNLKVVQVFSTVPLPSNLSAPFTEISIEELKQISALVTPHELVALIKIPDSAERKLESKGLVIALDNVQDPGNLGSIIRSAEWFGVHTIFCSNDTVDAYNSKVVQSSMGAIGNVAVAYLELLPQLEAMKATHCIYGAALKGNNVYKTTWTEDAVLLIGNEASGLGTKYDSVVTEYVSISKFGTVESLNASVACAILCSEYRRQR